LKNNQQNCGTQVPTQGSKSDPHGFTAGMSGASPQEEDSQLTGTPLVDLQAGQTFEVAPTPSISDIYPMVMTTIQENEE
jgi:hypothetical protein